MRNKFTLLTSILLITFMAGKAQFTTGKYSLGGDLNFSSENTKGSDVKNQAVNVTISFGKVVKENTLVGINLSYGHFNFENITEFDQKLNQYGAGIFYRKYKRLGKDFHLFGDGDLNYAYTEGIVTYENARKKVIDNEVSINLKAGLSYSLTRKMQIELIMPNIVGIGYSQEKYKYSDPNPFKVTPDNNTFSFLTNIDGNLLSNFGVGFKFILGK